MGYEATTVVIIYWNPEQPFFIDRDYHVWFDEYSFCLSIEDKHTPGSLLLQKYPVNLIHDSDLVNWSECEPGLTSTPFSNTTIFTY